MGILPSARAKQQIKSLFLFYLFVARTLGNCPKPESKNNIVLTDESLVMNEYPDNIVITLTCANGYVKDSGSATMMCIEGAWGDPDLTCKKKDCGPPPSLPHMIFDLNQGTLFGAIATVRCEEGYSVKGLTYKQCYNAGWTGKSTRCEIVTCAVPKEIPNGQSLRDSDSRPEYGEVISYSCDEGYTLTGKDKITCTAEGEYDSAPPQCLGGDILRATTITPTKPYYPQGDQNDDTVDTKKDVGYMPVIISVVCVTLVVCIAVLFINKLLNKRKGSYDTREDLKPELLQFQNL